MTAWLFFLFISLNLCYGWHSFGPARRHLSTLKMSTAPSPLSPYTAVMIVPTGVGAKIGGFAGDALPSAKLLSGVVDVLITHPNVMNGAMMYWPVENILYVEGHALNEFSHKRLALKPVRKGGHRIGVIFDKGMEEELQLRHLQVIDAARATLGINVQEVVVTAKSLGIDNRLSDESGASWGSVEETKALIDAAEILVSKGCTAIAVVGRFPEDDEIDAHLQSLIGSSGKALAASPAISAVDMFAAYRAGEGVDGIAGVEAIISHIISKRLRIPCAHAPAFLPVEADASVSPKACAEEIGYTFLPCVLAYLHRAPGLISYASDCDQAALPDRRDVLTAKDVDAVVVPYNALGSPAVFAFLQQRHTIVIAVLDNETSMRVTKEAFSEAEQTRIVLARSYAEAAGLLAAHKAGILFEALSPTVSRVPITHL